MRCRIHQRSPAIRLSWLPPDADAGSIVSLETCTEPSSCQYPQTLIDRVALHISFEMHPEDYRHSSCLSLPSICNYNNILGSQFWPTLLIAVNLIIQLLGFE